MAADLTWDLAWGLAGSGHGSEEGSKWGAGPQLISLRVLEGGCWWVFGKLIDRIKDMQ